MARNGSPADLIPRNLRALHGALEHSVTIQATKLQELMDDLVQRGSLTRAEADNLLSQLVSASKAYSQALLQVLDTVTETATAPMRATAGRLAGTVAQSVRQAPRLVPGRRKPAESPAPSVPRNASRPTVASVGATSVPDLATLTVPQAKARLAGLDASALRRLREQEVAGKNRKGVLDEIARQLG
jgi:polyhydroxyalkanoate synthesis regulator phasin